MALLFSTEVKLNRRLRFVIGLSIALLAWNIVIFLAPNSIVTAGVCGILIAALAVLILDGFRRLAGRSRTDARSLHLKTPHTRRTPRRNSVRPRKADCRRSRLTWPSQRP